MLYRRLFEFVLASEGATIYNKDSNLIEKVCII